MPLGDLIFHPGQWLRTTPMTPLALGAQKTWLSALIVAAATIALWRLIMPCGRRIAYAPT